MAALALMQAYAQRGDTLVLRNITRVAPGIASSFP